jgi:hypothetical protein
MLGHYRSLVGLYKSVAVYFFNALLTILQKYLRIGNGYTANIHPVGGIKLYGRVTRWRCDVVVPDSYSAKSVTIFRAGWRNSSRYNDSFKRLLRR